MNIILHERRFPKDTKFIEIFHLEDEKSSEAFFEDHSTLLAFSECLLISM